MDYMSSLPCPLIPTWVQPTEPWQKLRGRKESVVRLLISLAPSLRDHLGLHSSSSGRSILISKALSQLILSFQILTTILPLTILSQCHSRPPSPLPLHGINA